jgi:DNA polymerase-1
MDGLFGAEFNLDISLKKSDLKSKVKKLDSAAENLDVVDTAKVLKSKKLSIQDRLDVIKNKVIKILGKQQHHTVVIRSLNDFSNYITRAIEVGRCAVDTETNNSLDPITCKLMGLCLYVPGERQAYIPINHINPLTGELLPNQLTEEDCRRELQRLIDNQVFIVMHNGKFDYKVIKCTCGIEVVPDWDTMLAAKVLDENEFSAGLKQQYISKIDPSQKKYDIEGLFENVEYAQVAPEIFALYAATDSMMTDKLYLWQKPYFDAAVAENPDHNIYKLFMEVEMPCLQVVAEMELTGIHFDTDYADRLRVKYGAQLEALDTKVNAELEALRPKIEQWRATEGSEKAIIWAPQKSKKTQEEIEATFTNIDKSTGRRYKYGKSKSDMLEDPINLGSPAQLAILFYDILGLKFGDETDRSTGEDALVAFSKENELAKILLERRGVVKLLDAFINSLPQKVNPKTGKIHGSFHQYGAATGRFSSSEPNLQQVPSHAKNIRMLFAADTVYHKVEQTNNFYSVPAWDEVETTQGWIKAKDLQVGAVILGEDLNETVIAIQAVDNNYLLYV